MLSADFGELPEEYICLTISTYANAPSAANGVELFLGRLKGVKEPEKKRKIIGETFVGSQLLEMPSEFMDLALLTGQQIDLFEQEAIRIEKEAEHTPNAGKVSWFLQGTVCIPAQSLLD